MSIDDMEIAPNFTVSSWNALKLDIYEEDWIRAIVAFRNRIISRFISPADILIEAHIKDSSKKVGFAVLMIDFVIIETLQAFKEGIDDGDGRTLFVNLVTSEPSFNIKYDIAHRIYSRFRNSLSHQGQTKGNFRVNICEEEMIRVNGYEITINRTKFHTAVKLAFNRYCLDLYDSNDPIFRLNFRNKMNSICGLKTSQR